ncbi:MAG TPA: hypothetical protein VF711_13755 [Acidimicrobiales bacterium]
MEIHRSAHKHGVNDEAIEHAVVQAFVLVDIEPDADPPRVLAVGPDHAGNLLEVIWLELGGERRLVVHAMKLRHAFYELLPREEKPDA